MPVMESWQEITIGIIMMLVIGPAVGNYATSVIYRLPFGQTPFEKNPYCDDCGAMLQPKDLFPILSYLSTGGRCRYCKTIIPANYTLVEVLCGALFILHFLLYGVSEAFILLTAIGVFLIILASLERQEGKLYTLILTYLFALGAIWRTLQDGTVYDFFFSGFIMLFLAAVCWRLMLKSGKAGAEIPDIVWLMALMGVMLPVAVLPAACALGALCYMLQRLVLKSKLQSVAVSLAIMAGFWVQSCDCMMALFTL